MCTCLLRYEWVCGEAQGSGPESHCVQLFCSLYGMDCRSLAQSSEVHVDINDDSDYQNKKQQCH